MAYDRPITEKQATRAVEWFLELFGLGGWKIKLYLQDEPPAWCDDSKAMGMCLRDRRYKKVRIWVSNSKAKSEDVDTLECVMHECLHWLWSDIDIQGDDTADSAEFAWNRLARVLAFAFHHRMGVK